MSQADRCWCGTIHKPYPGPTNSLPKAAQALRESWLTALHVLAGALRVPEFVAWLNRRLTRGGDR